MIGCYGCDEILFEGHLALVCNQKDVLLICSNALGHNLVVLYLKVFNYVTYINKLETIQCINMVY